MTGEDAHGIGDRTIRPAVATAFGDAMDLADPPETLGDWIDEATAILGDAGFELGVGELCLTDDSRHEVRVAGEVLHVQCALDALLVPNVVDANARERTDGVEIRSRAPESDDVVTVDIEGGPDGEVTTSPNDAVVSFGVATDVEPPGADGLQPALAYDRFCPYVNFFPSAVAYERWDERTPEAVTTPLTVPEAVTLVDRFAEAIAGGDAG